MGANSNTNKAAAANSNQATIFSMKHKKMRTSTTAKKATTSTETNTNAKAKAATAAKTNTQAKKTNTQATNTNTNNQPLSNDLMGANADLLKQTGILAAAMAAGNKPPEEKKRIDLEKMGPIAFHSWVKFFKYKDQVATDKMARIKFQQSRKFFTNNEFREQLKLYPGQDYQEKGDDGEFKYLAVFYSSKIDDVETKRAIETFSYSDVRPVFEDDKKLGGIIDFGEFNEGSCAKVVTRAVGKLVWVICFENTSKKNTFIDLIRAIKIDEQHQDGL